ncbi:MAG TPA: hypothetical protein VML55_13065 [Planctomycetaceae bacterium]|nr:hypothetical protein [Planctomycetaceae bacterium]
MRTSLPAWLAALTVAAWLATAATARSDDEGFVRISDQAGAGPSASGSATCGPAGCPTEACPPGVCGPACRPDRRGCCLLGHKRCPGPHDHCCPLTAMLCCDACTHSPDHGWARPRHYPIHRVPVTYQQFWPDKWYGQPGSGFIGAYPMVYQPTDTTELGFYYQRVPYWTPKPWMLPPGPPWPPEWHHRDCLGPYDTPFSEFGPYGSPAAAVYAAGGGSISSAAAGREVTVERPAGSASGPTNQPGQFPQATLPPRPVQ